MEKDIGFHEAANIFPMDDENLDSLAADIKENGLLVPVELLDGKIIDGRRRYMACRMAEVEPDFLELDDFDCRDPVAYVLSLNLHRRHLTTSERAMVAAKARDVYDRAAKERMRQGGGDKKSDAAKSGKAELPTPISGRQARDEVGKALGVGGRTVDYGTAVLKKGSPELIEAVEKGEIPVSRAAEVVDMPKPDQLEEAKKRRSERDVETTPEPQHDSDGSNVATEKKGRGMQYAVDAVNCLKMISRTDPQRKRAFQFVTDYIKANKGN